MNHSARLQKLMGERMRPLLVTSLVNIRYLTGFTGSNAFLVVFGDRSVFVTDGRYGEIATPLAAALPGCELVVYTADLPGTLAAAIGDTESIDVEAEHVSWAFSRRLDDVLDATLNPTTGIVESLRLTKDEDEIAALRRAAGAGDAAFDKVAVLRREVETEGELGLVLIDEMRAAGGEAAGWPPIVAFGANAARPHHRSGEGPASDGLLLMDYGCVVDGYHSDMTRTVWLGDARDDTMEAVYAAVKEANDAGIAAVKPGVKAGDVDEVCRAVLRKHGYEEFFIHSTGHGVGLEIHEGPWVKRGSKDVLEPGHVITIEPGVYLPGHGGVRIEDMVLVTENGNEVLTMSHKDMRVG